MKLTLLGLTGLIVVGGGLFMSSKYDHTNNVESSFLLSEAYSLLQENQSNVMLSRSDLVDVVNMGGIYSIHNYNRAVAGACNVAIDNQYYETIQLDVISQQDPESPDAKLYDAQIKVIGLPENINAPAREFSENISQILRSSFLSLKGCFIEAARNASIDQLK